jgi:hypothetical protein
MANELNIALAKSGLTVTAQRYQSGAAVGSAISCPETGSSGFYSGNMTGTAGTYQVAFISASANVGSGSIVWDGTAEVPVSTITTADIPSAAISAIQAKTDNLPSDPADQSLIESAISALSIPSVVQIRTELDSNSTKLANLDATVSSRLAPSGTLATVTTLTNAPTVPTAAAIATQVRTELATELARVDAAVSTRLATSGYTAPSTAPTAAANASAVRTELATELARVDVATSTRLASSAYTAPANSDITAIKAKTDLLNTDRLANVATTAIVGNLIAQANS